MKRITIMERLSFALLFIRNLYVKLISSTYSTFVFTFHILPAAYIEWISHIRAKYAYALAVKKVPAYQDFVTQQGESVPEMDKKSYIVKYETAQRCLGGSLPKRFTAIDESSGSTGRPYNWIRSRTERRESHHFISYFTRYCYGDSVDIVLNAFSLGAWATGMNMGAAMEKNFIVKNIGPDLDKIFHTLEFFGPKYRYLILGYPPFLKWFIDVAKERSFPIQDYNLQALVGGEGMSEGLRDYLYPVFKKVYSGYGATDLEIGIAGETPISLGIRRLARKDETLREVLFGTDSRLPMVFQYNPLMHYMEINTSGELVCTITRSSILSPRIRYNIHDQAGIMRYDQMKSLLAEHGYKIEDLIERQSPALKLPFLWIYGRKDFTISIMGANIYPEDIEQFVYADDKLAPIIHSFCQTTVESENGMVRPGFYFEMETDKPPALENEIEASLLTFLRQINSDYREAYKEYPEVLKPIVKLYGLGQGPFSKDKSSIKQKRIV